MTINKGDSVKLVGGATNINSYFRQNAGIVEWMGSENSGYGSTNLIARVRYSNGRCVTENVDAFSVAA